MRTRALTCSVLLHGQNANFGLANIFWSIGLLIVTAQSSVAQGTNHELACTAGKVQLGRYDAAVKPVLTIKSGDTVRAESCFSPIEDPLVSPSEISTNWRPAIESITDKSGPGVHLLTGPILVEAAEPGDVLEVHFQKFELRVPFGVVAIMPTFAALPIVCATCDRVVHGGARGYRLRPGPDSKRVSYGWQAPRRLSADLSAVAP